jgi:hypothetical protein
LRSGEQLWIQVFRGVLEHNPNQNTIWAKFGVAGPLRRLVGPIEAERPLCVRVLKFQSRDILDDVE